MRIDVFTPLPPLRTEIANHSQSVLRALSARCEVFAWTTEDAACAGLHPRRIRRYGPAHLTQFWRDPGPLSRGRAARPGARGAAAHARSLCGRHDGDRPLGRGPAPPPGRDRPGAKRIPRAPIPHAAGGRARGCTRLRRRHRRPARTRLRTQSGAEAAAEIRVTTRTLLADRPNTPATKDWVFCTPCVLSCTVMGAAAFPAYRRRVRLHGVVVLGRAGPRVLDPGERCRGRGLGVGGAYISSSRTVLRRVPSPVTSISTVSPGAR